MAQIELREVAHSYYANPKDESDYAIKRIHDQWEDGGAYALARPFRMWQNHPAQHHFRFTHTQPGKCVL